MRSMYTSLGASSPFDPTDRYTTSWLLPPTILATLRLLLSLYAFTTIFVIFGWNDAHDGAQRSRRSFSYFTNLTYWGLAFYFLVSGLHTLSYARSGKSWLQTWPRALQAAHAVFYTTVITFPFLVTIVYWAILYSDPWFPVVFQAWSNISQHALNSLLALLEIILPRTSPPPFLHLPILILILALYLALAYITRAAQGFYTYSFLDPGDAGRGRVAGYVIGIAVAVGLVFGGAWGAVWARRRMTEERWGGRGSSWSDGDLEMRSDGK